MAALSTLLLLTAIGVVPVPAKIVPPVVVHNYFVPLVPQAKCVYSHFDNGYGYEWRNCVETYGNTLFP
jgi:hypothetical protein